MIRRNRPVGNIVQQLSDGANKLTKGSPYYLKNIELRRELDAKSASLGEITNLLCTLINDLKEKGIIQ